MLAAVPAKFDPAFVEKLSKRYAITRAIKERRQALEDHWGGNLSYVQKSVVRRVLWLELLAEVYEQRVANGEEVDIGAITQISNTLKGFYKEIGYAPKSKSVRNLRDVMGSPS